MIHSPDGPKPHVWQLVPGAGPMQTCLDCGLRQNDPRITQACKPPEREPLRRVPDYDPFNEQPKVHSIPGPE